MAALIIKTRKRGIVSPKPLWRPIAVSVIYDISNGFNCTQTLILGYIHTSFRDMESLNVVRICHLCIIIYL